ncbi:hypothetical protein BpHYR1_016531 [Brachionus plicatilis]|uniref:Uncharacterized protein n=1 Tax=Brachionus plicatilis TaxID=10195 RepID=A0A3M7R8D2_BRAPC|nr:hypothetical protein BpHYR1_016531 [Brachionus plicatilis]
MPSVSPIFVWLNKSFIFIAKVIPLPIWTHKISSIFNDSICFVNFDFFSTNVNFVLKLITNPLIYEELIFRKFENALSHEQNIKNISSSVIKAI